MRLLAVLIAIMIGSFSLTASAAPNGGTPLYSIQLGASAKPNLDKFSKLKKYGHLYTVDVGNGMQRILLGTYSSKSKATRVLSSVKSKGFKDAFLSANTLGSDEVYVVQFMSYSYGEKINWNKLQEVGTIQVDPSDGKIKVINGSFSEKYVADSHIQNLKVLGYNDAFVRKINADKLLNIGINYGNTITSSGGEVPIFEDMPIYSQLSEYERKSVVILDGIYSIHDKANNTFIPLNQYTPGSIGGYVVSSPTTPTYSAPTTTYPSTTTTTYPSTTTYPTTTTSTVYEPATTAADVYVASSVSYKIQLAAVRNYDDVLFNTVRSLGTVSREDNGQGIQRVLLGDYYDISSAQTALNAAKSNGFNGAYIVTYTNGVRGAKIN